MAPAIFFADYSLYQMAKAFSLKKYTKNHTTQYLSAKKQKSQFAPVSVRKETLHIRCVIDEKSSCLCWYGTDKEMSCLCIVGNKENNARTRVIHSCRAVVERDALSTTSKAESRTRANWSSAVAWFNRYLPLSLSLAFMLSAIFAGLQDNDDHVRVRLQWWLTIQLNGICNFKNFLGGYGMQKGRYITKVIFEVLIAVYWLNINTLLQLYYVYWLNINYIRFYYFRTTDIQFSSIRSIELRKRNWWNTKNNNTIFKYFLLASHFQFPSFASSSYFFTFCCLQPITSGYLSISQVECLWVFYVCKVSI